MNSDTEKELIERAKAGDQSAFSQLVTLHYDKVYGQAYRMMKKPEDAKDVTQLAWIKAWNKLSSFKGDSAFSSWLYRVVTFTALDAIRKRNSRREAFVEDEFLEVAANTETSHIASPQQIRYLERKELKTRISQAIDSLPEKLRDTFKLREIEGLSYDEIAQQLNCKIGTVMSRLFNARKTIQQHLTDLIS